MSAVNWNEWHVFSSLFAFIFIYLLYYSASLIALPHTFIVSILFSPSFSEFPSFMNGPVGRLCWVSWLFSHSYLCCERESFISPFQLCKVPSKSLPLRVQDSFSEKSRLHQFWMWRSTDGILVCNITHQPRHTLLACSTKLIWKLITTYS